MHQLFFRIWFQSKQTGLTQRPEDQRKRAWSSGPPGEDFFPFPRRSVAFDQVPGRLRQILHGVEPGLDRGAHFTVRGGLGCLRGVV